MCLVQPSLVLTGSPNNNGDSARACSERCRIKEIAAHTRDGMSEKTVQNTLRDARQRLGLKGRGREELRRALGPEGREEALRRARNGQLPPRPPG